jgi:serine/threonine protein kinase
MGVGEYLRAEHIEKLRFATYDAAAVAETLANPSLCAFPPDQVVLLTNREAQRDEIVQRLSRWLPEQARGMELVVIYFAGHGMVQSLGRRQEGYLLPYDADPDDVVTRGVAMGDIARWIDGLDARAVVVCLDCCHAGKVLGSRDPARGPATRNMELRPALLQAMSGQGRYLIASCDEGQQSYECAELGHGLFTYHLLRGIQGEADRDGDGRVGLAELFNYVSTAVSRDALEKFGREQKPWTSATWAEETYISTHNRTMPPQVDRLEQIYRDKGAAAVVREIEQEMAGADQAWLSRALRLLRRVKEPTGIPAICRYLSHADEAIRGEARAAFHALGWETVVSAVEDLARRSERERMTAVLDGLNAFEAHPRVVALLDRLFVLLKGDLRNRTILLLERKRLGLGLDDMAALFREIRSPYRIQKVLGQGLFTDSYLARHEETDLEVVVRVLRPDFARQPHVRAAFLDLCNRSVPLVHEKLALTRDARAFPDRNVYFVVRDYIPGVTLQRVLEGGRLFEPPAALRILREVVTALTPLQRIVACHGGIKPSNIFLCEGDRVMLGDPCPPVQGFGMALDRLSYDYRYAPPEMFLGGGELGQRSDFYALGCVAYELVCGAPPFVSDNFHELAARHIHDPITPPSQRGSSLGVAGDATILKLLARSPAERYDTVEEVLQAIASLERELEQIDSRRERERSPAITRRPVLRDASIANYQGGQSVLNFEQTSGSLSEGPRTLSIGPAASEESPLQIPGYEILEVLGRGGMGTVYKARDVRLERLIALKVLPAGLEVSAESVSRYLTEGKAVARLQHPNIVQIYALFEHEGTTCLALEYVGGGDLRRLLENQRREEPLSFRNAAQLITTVARAVDFAHQRGVLHRDLKPSNILLTSEGQPKIADFGLSAIQEHLAREADQSASGLMGTPRYMAPEQFKGKAGPASDVYALGMIFFETLTGSSPFEPVADIATTMYQTLTRPPSRPSQVRPEVPPELEAICLKCLEKEPAQRYPGAGALADDLERWLRGETINVHSQPDQASHSPRPSVEQVPTPVGGGPVREGEALAESLLSARQEPRPPKLYQHSPAPFLGFWRRLANFFSFRKSGGGTQSGQAPE